MLRREDGGGGRDNQDVEYLGFQRGGRVNDHHGATLEDIAVQRDALFQPEHGALPDTGSVRHAGSLMGTQNRGFPVSRRVLSSKTRRIAA